MNIRPALCLISLSAALGLNARDIPDPGSQPPLREQGENPTPESTLAKQVADIASSASLSHREKAKQIANAVRLAVIAATANVKDTVQALKIAVDLATAAAEAAPNYAEAILNAMIGIPSISGIEGALPKLKAAITEAVTAAEHTVVVSPFTPHEPPQNPEFGGGTGDIVVSPSR